MTRKRLAGLLLLVMAALPWHTFAAEIETYIRLDTYEGFQAFTIKHHDVTFSQNHVFYQTTTDFNAALIAGTMTSDLVSIATNHHDVQSIMKKGYCTDLSNYPNIAGVVNRLYPHIRAQCMADGKIYAVPELINCEYYRIVPETWNMLGYSQENKPNSFLGLLDWIEEWIEKAESDDIRNIHVIQFDPYGYDANSYPVALIEESLKQYMMQLQYAGQVLRFNDPYLRDILERCRTLGGRLYQQEQPPSENETLTQYAILQNYSISMPDGLSSMIPQRFQENQPNLLQCNLSMLMVPSVSQEKDLACELLNDLVTGKGISSDINRIFLFPDEPLPVDPEYETTKQLLEERIAAIQKDIDRGKTKDATGQSLETMKEMLEMTLNTYIKPYLVAPETIEAYRSMVDGLYFPKPSVFSASEADISTYNDLKKQFASGIISVDEFLSRLDQMARMMEAEQG